MRQDYLEGILVEDMGIECSRYDGDMRHEDRRKELRKFKTTETCRVLLSTVHVCGTGLNIVEANHVFFVDRWFNPTVHDQEMDRCYRIGQKKDVFVEFFDSIGTIDVGMMLTNKYKKENSAILLADGTVLGEANVNFRQLNGVMKDIIRTLQLERLTHVHTFGRDTAFPTLQGHKLQSFLDRVTGMINKNLKRRAGEDDSAQ